MDNLHKHTLIRFKTPLSVDETVSFRGAVLEQFGTNVLFHNHTNEGYRYSYPLIQYKSMDGRAALLGIDAGADVLLAFPGKCPMEVRIGKRITKLEVDSVDTYSVPAIVPDNKSHYYRMYDWLPFNQDNYKDFRKMLLLTDRIHALENILSGNILSYAKGMGYFVDCPLHIGLISIDQHKSFAYKGVQLYSMHITFTANVFLPAHVGLGKSVSIGHGVVCPISCSKPYDNSDLIPAWRS